MKKYPECCSCGMILIYDRCSNRNCKEFTVDVYIASLKQALKHADIIEKGAEKQIASLKERIKKLKGHRKVSEKEKQIVNKYKNYQELS